MQLVIVSLSLITFHSVVGAKLRPDEDEVILDPLEELAATIPGKPGDDYPIFSSPPETRFVCDGYVSGYYADQESRCQAYHVCASDGQEGLIKYSFLCPNGTVFNQQYFICDWWFNVDCSQAGEFYSINFEIEAAMKAEKIDLQGGSGSDLTGDNNGQYSPSSSSVSDYNTNSDTDPFRTGPLDYTL